MPTLQKIHLVTLLENDTHPVLSSVLMDGGIQAIDKIYSEVRCVVVHYTIDKGKNGIGNTKLSHDNCVCTS